MSFSTPSTLPAINPLTEPAKIRTGGAAAQRAYQVGLSFEQVLVDQLSQQLTAATGDGSSGSDSSSDGSGGSSNGLMGSDPASSMYAQMLPQALDSSIMSAGGLGIAAQLASSLDPALNAPPASAATGSSAPSSGAAGADAAAAGAAAQVSA